MHSLTHRTSTLFAPNGERKYLNTAEIQRFLREAEKYDERIWLLCLVLAYTGCRLSEALALKRQYIDPDRGCIVFETLKQRRKGIYRQIPIPIFLAKKLCAYSARNGFERIWPINRQTARRWVQQVLTDADIKGLRATTRGLRHGFAVDAVSCDIPIALLQRWLGHSRISSTIIYLNIVGPEERGYAERRWVMLG